MTDPTRPLNHETLDEVLSADIDGELDRAATDLGLTPDEARAAIAGAPDADIRRRALEAARDRFSTQPTLEPAIVSQLVAAALSQATAPIPIRSHRRQRVWRTLAGAAAAAAVIAGVVALAAKNPGSEVKSSSTAAAGAHSGASDTPRNPLTAKGSVLFGDVSRAQALRVRVRDELGPRTNAPIPESAAAGPSGSPGHDGLQLPAASGTYKTGISSTKSEFAANHAALRACVSSIETSRHLRGAPILSGTGISLSRPVYVVVFREAGTTVAYVLAAGDCSVVARATVP